MRPEIVCNLVFVQNLDRLYRKIMRMKKLILALAIFVSCPVWAEWKFMDQNVDFKVYIDPETIRKDGRLRKVWVLHDDIKVDERGAKSRQLRHEYDCKNERYRFLSYTLHGERWAQGITILLRTPENDPWTDIPPNTPIEDVLKIVCAR